MDHLSFPWKKNFSRKFSWEKSNGFSRERGLKKYFCFSYPFPEKVAILFPGKKSTRLFLEKETLFWKRVVIPFLEKG